MDTLLIFNLHDHVYSCLMASALKLSVQPCLHDILRQFHTYDAGAERQDIRVVVLSGKPCRCWLRANGRADALHFIGSQRDAYSSSADQDAQIHFV